MQHFNINRNDLLSYLPKECKVAEIGVARGFFSYEILENTKPRELYLIDAWENFDIGYPDKNMVSSKRQQKRYKSVVNQFNNYNEVTIIRKRSVDSAQVFDDCYLDWVYIDADHSYAGCLNDLNAFSNKVKENGFICGHDWLANGFNREGFGVNSAVLDFVKSNNYRLSLITNEDKHASYVIAKNKVSEENLLNKLV